MLPILITFLIIMIVIAVVYAVGSQPSKGSTKTSKTPMGFPRASAPRSRPAKTRSGFHETPSWLRKLPLVLVILAVVSLVIALAQFRVAKSRATPTIALVIDASNSMDATDVQPNRLQAAESAAQGFLQKLPPDFAVSLVSFSDQPKVLVEPTTDHTLVANALSTLPRGHGTVIGDGLAAGLQEIEKSQGTSQAGPAAIVLLSDGKSVRGSDPVTVARAAKKAKVPIYTVSLGTPQGTIPLHDKNGNVVGTTAVPPDPQTLARIAAVSGARSFDVRDEAKLSAVYKSLGSQIARKKQPRQITAGFAGGALAF
ncbi:MAG TPA: VWA domain-containing protein, partial [Actinomycetota bacterium]|nr:VWA domain-containing protein [Actinomycetota bacterium]